MVKKENTTATEPAAPKQGRAKRVLIKLVVLAAIAGAGYGVWKNPQILDQVKSAFERQPQADVYQPQIDALRGQIRSLQQQLAMTAAQIREPDMSAVNARMAGVENKVSNIEKVNLNVMNSKADAATVLGVVTRLDKTEHKLDKLAEVTDDSALTLTALMLVKDAAERGGSFEYEAEVLNNVVADNPQLKEKAARLALSAKDGIMPKWQLVQDFNQIYAGLSMNNADEAEKTWKERLNTKLGEIVQIKKTNTGAAESASEHNLELVHRQVQSGNLHAAVKLLMQPQNAEVMKNESLQKWVKQVQTREDFYALINNMSASSLAVMKVRFLKKN